MQHIKDNSDKGKSRATEKKVILTGIKPTEVPHWGNYFGAIRPGIDLAAKMETSLLFIADYHALTTVHEADKMREYTRGVAATWIACGLDPKHSVIYRQSDVPEIFELSWILACFAPKGLLNRAHAYKARVQENEDAKREDLDFGVSMGLYFYPILMAADILMFKTDVVPVGEDQVQHVEIARDIAQKFNRTYGQILKLPQHLVQAQKLIPGLDGRKMSKSYGNHIPIFLESTGLRKTIMKIVTDSQPPEAPKDPTKSVIFDLYKEIASPAQIADLQAQYEKGIGWGVAKQKLFEAADEFFKKPRETYHSLMNSPEQLEKILQEGAAKARALASPYMAQIRKAVRGE